MARVSAVNSAFFICLHSGRSGCLTVSQIRFHRVLKWRPPPTSNLVGKAGDGGYGAERNKNCLWTLITQDVRPSAPIVHISAFEWLWDAQETEMDTTTLLIIILIVLVLAGGGWFGRGRWY